MTVETFTGRAASCDGDAPKSLSVSEARARVLACVDPVAETVCHSLRACLGRVLAEDVFSPIDVPAHTNSAMDGYALRGPDLPSSGTGEYRVVGEAFAGHPFAQTVQRGECVRIMTGAPIPAGADTVVMQEHAERRGETVVLKAGHRPGQNVRAAGEDLARGDIALHAGTLVGPAELGIAASLGITEARVRRPARVAFFSTGDELRSVGSALHEGEIYDSNRYTLYGMLTRLGVELLDLGVVRDRPSDLRAAFEDACAAADAVITSGGVSVGEADYVKDLLDELGEVNVCSIAMKPGRPFAFGRMRGSCFFGLPGNPVAVMVTFFQLVQPALHRLQGLDPLPQPLLIRMPCDSALKKRRGRTEFYRGLCERGSDGSYRVRKTGHQGSGILRSMSLANCFIVLNEDNEGVNPGELVDVQPFTNWREPSLLIG